ncbi:hypothetical protein J2TS6_15510 [Paenibacillus albilobatus]|uniref:HTH araC/xylS-type domain-containing protein n=1 Tax=Paenibacillus albilobatus TaxID=2716884 RepID=A0A919XH25_9BACL|nr:response regulator transcription factor [Paenibacillus albilobatus]GIO30410.1 hypothetical protein J2TS6_15510 [Paenibacillus albilobatus]
MRYKGFGSGTFRNIFLSYTAILIIPIIVFSALNVHRNMMEEKQQQHQKHAADAKRIADLVDSKLNELKNMGKMLGNEAWVKKLMQNTNVYDQEFDMLKMLEIRKSLDNGFNSLGILSFGMVVFPEKRQVLTQWGVYPEEDFFKGVAVFDGDTKQKLQHVLSQQQYFKIMPPADMKLWGNGKRVIPVLQSLEVVNHPRAVLVLFIDSAYFSDYMHRFGGIESKAIAISSQGSLLYRQARNDSAGHPERSRSYELVLPSRASDLRYAITYADTGVIGINNLFGSLLAIAISAGLGALAAFLLAKVSYRPLGALLNKLSAAVRFEEGKNGGSISGSEYSYIEKSFDRLLLENKNLQQTMQDYESAARSNLFLRLLKGYFADDQQMNGLKKFGIGYTDDMQYCTMLISFYAIRDVSDMEKIRKIEMITIVIVEQAMKRHRVDYELFEVTNADKALILSSVNPFGDDRLLERIASEISGEIEQACGFRPDVFCGTVEKGVVGISKSYYAANERLQYTIFSREHLPVQQEEAVQAGVDYYYPTDWEVQLVNNLKIGNLDTTMQILHEIAAENKKRELPESSEVKLVSLLMETLLRVLHELNLDTCIYAKQFASRAGAGEMEEMWSCVLEVGTLICERKRYANTSPSLAVGSELLQFVNQNYTSADLSLKMLAEMCGMSVSNVSKIFKEVSGINFYDYVCRLRMETAKELLREKKFGMDVIARRVGYENVYSFKRAFARYEGIKPDEYVDSAM